MKKLILISIIGMMLSGCYQKSNKIFKEHPKIGDIYEFKSSNPFDNFCYHFEVLDRDGNYVLSKVTKKHGFLQISWENSSPMYRYTGKYAIYTLIDSTK